MLFLIIFGMLALIMGINWLIGFLATLVIWLVCAVIVAVAIVMHFVALSDAKDEIQQ